MDRFDADLRRNFQVERVAGQADAQARKEQFREYLRATGVHGGLSTALKLLFEAKVRPKDPVLFIRSKLGQPRISVQRYQAMKVQLRKRRKRLEELELEVAKIRAERQTVITCTTEPEDDEEPELEMPDRLSENSF